MKKTVPTEEKWRGYTLEELRNRIAINDKLIDAEKKALNEDIEELKAVRNNTKTVTKKVLGALSYVDYLMLGLAIFRKIRSVASIFRKK